MRNESILKHVTNSQTPSDLISIYRPFSWQSTRKIVFVPTLLVQKWTSGFFFLLACLNSGVLNSFLLVFFQWHDGRVPITTLMSTPSKLPSQSCCTRPSLFFPARLSILLHPNLSPQGIRCALDPQLTPCFVGNCCLYGGADHLASCQSIAKDRISHLMHCHHRPVS